MPLYAKILIILGSILIFGLLGFIIYNQKESAQRQLAIEAQIVQQKELVDKIVRSQSEYTSKKDLEEFIKNNGVSLTAVKKDLDKLNAQVEAMNIILVASNSQKVTNLPSSSTGPENPDPPVVSICKDGTPCPNADPFGYLRLQQNRTLSEDFGELKLPIGSVGFSAWKDKPWSIDIKGREYKVSSVIGVDPNQRTYVYNKVSVTIDGQNYDLPIKQAITKQQYPSASWSWWNPRLFLGIDGGMSLNPISPQVTPSISLGISSYGKYIDKPDFSIIQIGAGISATSQKPQLLITPVSYNIGNHIPLIKNTYVAPSLHIDTDKNISTMLGLRVGL